MTDLKEFQRNWNSLRSITAVTNFLTFYLIYRCLCSFLFIYADANECFTIILKPIPKFSKDRSTTLPQVYKKIETSSAAKLL